MKLPAALNPAAILGFFAVLSLGLVALIHHHTAERIAANERAQWLRTLDTLVPAASFDNDPLTDTVTVQDITLHRARHQGQPVAAIFETTAPDGYNGAIKLLVAVKPDGVLAGVRVLSHRETPGLGDVIEADKSPWILGFAGRSLNNPPEALWQVKRDGGDFDQFAGATITPRAVVKAVRLALAFYQQHHTLLFTADTGSEL